MGQKVKYLSGLRARAPYRYMVSFDRTNKGYLMPQTAPLILYGARGGGSAIIEALLTLTGEPYDVRYLAWEDLGAKNSDYARINPLGEIPALKLPDSSILTESAAICLWLADRHENLALLPGAGHPDRPQFLRCLMWLVASIYPTFTFGDHPEKYVPEGEASEALLSATENRRKMLWRQMEQALPLSPYALGDHMTALDIYISVMTRWRPRWDWFKTHCPKLYGVACRVDAHPDLSIVWRENFDTQD